MHALAIDHVAALGGAEFSLETLVERMPPGRCRYTVALPGPGPFTDRLRRKALPVTEVRLESWRWWVRNTAQLVKFFPTLPLQVVSLGRWIGMLQRLRPDVVHLNVCKIVEPLVAARLLGIPSVVHFRELPSRLRHRFVVGRENFYRLMNLADAWIANSTATADDIRPHCRRPLHVVPNGLDLAAFDAASAAHRSDVHALLLPTIHHVAMVAGVNSWKRQADFVELAIRVLQTRRDTAFYIVGAHVDREYAASLVERVGQVGVGDRVRFLGRVECVPALMQAIDALVHTTPYEPFGRVFLEGMAARCPVIAWNNGGAAEVVVDGQTGTLVPQGALDAMADAVTRVLDNADLRRRMGQAGRARVESRYSIQAHCDAIATVYETLVSPGAAQERSA